MMPTLFPRYSAIFTHELHGPNLSWFKRTGKRPDGGKRRIPAGDSAAIESMSPYVSVRQMMTLRQIEVIRAVMVTGTIGGAARLLNVSAPGISRLVKYTEKSLG